ncbi:MAG: PilZ domain-containing protein [Proteobacteria bacterium]|nr:PilZ domain-containing protein [Pseudomonadota bacterium]MBU1739409.1 PilZ domain-containing protein [Pseudomonadota bacterium]
MTNRRENTRVKFKGTIDLHFPGRSFADCETSDLCLHGVFVAGVSGLAAGDECDVSLRLSGATSDIVLRMKGKVARLEKNGVGLKFSEIDLDSFYHLKNILYYNSGDPDVLEEEFQRQLAGK